MEREVPDQAEAEDGESSSSVQLTKATTITGQVASLGSYRLASWRSLPGMAIQGLMLKTDQGNIEVYLGPPSYVTEQKFSLQIDDTTGGKWL